MNGAFLDPPFIVSVLFVILIAEYNVLPQLSFLKISIVNTGCSRSVLLVPSPLCLVTTTKKNLAGHLIF